MKERFWKCLKATSSWRVNTHLPLRSDFTTWCLSFMDSLSTSSCIGRYKGFQCQLSSFGRFNSSKASSICTTMGLCTEISSQATWWLIYAEMWLLLTLERQAICPTRRIPVHKKAPISTLLRRSLKRAKIKSTRMRLTSGRSALCFTSFAMIYFLSESMNWGITPHFLKFWNIFRKTT